LKHRISNASIYGSQGAYSSPLASGQHGITTMFFGFGGH